MRPKTYVKDSPELAVASELDKDAFGQGHADEVERLDGLGDFGHLGKRRRSEEGRREPVEGRGGGRGGGEELGRPKLVMWPKPS